MRTYTKLSALAAAFLIGSVSAQGQTIPTIAEALGNKTQIEGSVDIQLDDKVVLEAPDQTPPNVNKEASVLSVETPQESVLNIKEEPQETANAVLANSKTSDTSVYTIELPNNGLIYASQDPSIGHAVLSVSTLPYAALSEGAITEPISFYIRSNYAAFIEKMELSVYRGADRDLTEPLVTIPVNPASFGVVSWDGKLPDRYNYSINDELIYVLKAYDKEGRFDETSSAAIKLLRAEDVKNAKDDLKEFISKERGSQLSANDAAAQYLLNEVFSSNSLYRQNIAVYGSRIIIRGTNIPDGTSVLINNSAYPIDFERKFTAEYIMPEGVHYYDIKLAGAYSLSDKLKVEVEPYYFFGVAIADFTLSKAQSEGSSLSRSDDLLKDGRLAFYVKGKAYSKYQITAQADTTQKDVKKLFNGFTQADPKDLFESLDPDMYYPTYGDDSETFKDVNTQGRFYVKVGWDKSEALWGNYNTAFDATQYASYSRSLYGAKLDYRSLDINQWGDANTVIKAFGSQAESMAGHAEFLGTGGSLYYLKHTDIIPGSDKLLLQVTDKLSGNIIARIELLRGADYEIDNIQGRVILSRPLSQIIYQNVHSITSVTPLGGYEQRLIADYEFVPSGFEDDYVTAGIRAKEWITDNVAVGGTYVREGRDGDDYELAGADLTLQAGKGTYLKAEFSHSKSEAAPIYYSDNGGFSFSSLGSNANGTSGNAIAVDGRVNFKELGLTDNELSVGAWWRDVEGNFSASSSSLSSNGITEYGAEAVSEINKNINLYAKFSRAEKQDDAYAQAQITSEYKLLDKLSISAEVLHSKSETSASSADNQGTIGALRIDYDILPNLETFLTGQVTLYNDDGRYDNNDAIIVGTRYLYGDSSIGARYTTGHRGSAAQIDVSQQLSKDHTVYGGYTWSNDYASDFDSVFGTNKNTGLTVGQRWSLTNRVTLFNESQYLKNEGDRGSMNSLGMDFYLGEGWNLGFVYQKGEVDSSNGLSDVTRDSFSASVGQTSSVMNWLSKLEYRIDKGTEEREQWVTTNRLSYKVDESLRLAGRFNYSKTKDNLVAANGAEFMEANIGFAYRPFDSDRWAIFGRYTYLYDLATLGQDVINGSYFDQKSQVISLEGVYKLDEKWEFALKYATRAGKARFGRGTGGWFDSATSFYAGQVRYDLFYKWHGLVEYRLLDVKDGGVKQGYMIGLDRDLTENLRIGVGYNFTDFSDDLTKLDYRYKGWFVNIVGTY
jgi:hypothetical protein